MTEQTETGSNLPRRRGRSKKSLELIEAIYQAAAASRPITGRGIGYKLFVRKLIPSMQRGPMQSVYRLLKEAREDGTIPLAVGRRRDTRPSRSGRAGRIRKSSPRR